MPTQPPVKWYANAESFGPRRYEIEHDSDAGFYVLVFEGDKCVRDHLQDTQGKDARRVSTMKTDFQTTFKSCFEKLYGMPAWHVRPGHGSFLTMEFGNPYLKIIEPRQHRREEMDEILGRVMTMDDEEYSMVQECTNYYTSKEINEREVEILIRIPKRFYSLWLSKLSDLRTNMSRPSQA